MPNSEHDAEKLLGGFATDTLTAEERRALFEAALHDQHLFDALADEQALKELLSDPASRRRILALLKPPPAETATPWAARFVEWFRQPANVALAGGLSAAALAIVVGTQLYEESLRTTAKPVATEEATPPAQTPAPAQEERPVRPESPALAPQSQGIPPAPRSRSFDKRAVRLPAPAREPVPQPEPKSIPREEEALPTAGGDVPRGVAAPIRSENLPVEREQAPAQASPEQPKVDMPPPAAPPRAIKQPNSGAGLISASTSIETSVAGIITERKVSARALFYGQAGLPTAEEIFRETSQVRLQTDETPSTPARPLGLRYSLVVRGQDGRDVEVSPSADLTGRDEPRLTIVTNDHGFLFVWHEERPGTTTLLFPPPPSPPGEEQQPAGAEVSSGTYYTIPLPVGSPREGPAPQGRLVILFARQPGMDVTNVLAELERSKSARKSLLIEEIDPRFPGSPNEQAVYIVNPDPGPTARLVVERPLAGQ